MPNSDYDVVVVGGGNTAMIAALSAYEAGARVAMLEAAPREERGGNSRFAGTLFRFVHDGVDDVKALISDEEGLADLERCGIGPYTYEKFYEDQMTSTRNRSDPALTDTLIKESHGTVKWMRDRGVKFVTSLNMLYKKDSKEGKFDLSPGVAVMVKNAGVGLTDNLWETVEKTKIKVFYESPAQELIQQGDKVLGVRARQPDGYVDFLGQIILAESLTHFAVSKPANSENFQCGGFEANPRLRAQYLGPGWEAARVRGTRFNTGIMLEKLISAGASPMGGQWGMAHSSPQDINCPLQADITTIKGLEEMSRYSFSFSIMVNLDGQRFVDEGMDEFSLVYSKMGAAIARQPESVAYQIFDQQTVHLLEPRYHKTGTPIVADTLAGLAEKLKINPSTLGKMVQQFNAATGPGTFDPFHKDGLATAADFTGPPKSNWATPINRPPYVAYGVTAGITFTYGGVKTDTRARVLNIEGKPMPGVYAAGEITGGFWYSYAAGAALMRASVFAKIAGEEAARRSLDSSVSSRL